MRRSIVESARSFIGTPFHMQGRLKGVGIDCLGLFVGVCREAGIPFDDRPEFKSQARRMLIGGQMKEYCDRCLVPLVLRRRAEPLPGDLLLFWMDERRKRPQHVAFLSTPNEGGRRRIIHTYSAVKRVVEQVLDQHWSRRIAATYRLPGVEESWRR